MQKNQTAAVKGGVCLLNMDLSELDRLRDQLYRSSADADEALYIVNRLRAETANDELLKGYPQYEALADDLVCADSTLTHIKETLFDLGKTVSEAAIICRAGESEKATIIKNDR